MAYADVEIRIFERIAVKEENKEVERYPVELTVNSEREFPRGYLDPEEQPPTPTKSGYADEDYGNRLFRWLFSDKALSNAWAEIRGAYPQRRLQLRIDPDEPELHRVVWEALRDPGDIKRLPLALATTDATPFSRYLALPSLHGKPIYSRPIRILLVAPAQKDFREKYPADQYPDLAEINPAEELESLTLALQEPIAQGVVAPPKLLEQPCSLARIMDELRNGNEGKGYHVLHMVCHGSFSTAAQRAKLWLATNDNLIDSLTDTQFATTLYGLLSESGIQDEDKLRLVFLASCESATRSSADAFRGVAPQLVKAGVPAVVAMQDQVGEQTAREFTAVFYGQLFRDGQDGQVDLAANVARAQITAKHLPGPVIPVLFLRLPNGQLFSTTQIVPRKSFEPETVPIPAGEFLMGSNLGSGISRNETPQHTVKLPTYFISKYPVTNAQYAVFLQRRPSHPALPPPAKWRPGRKPPKSKEQHPVTWVSLADASAYCRWLSEETKHTYRLPTEAEWEKAARGVHSLVYPWGNEWTDGRCNIESTDTIPVAEYEEDASPYDCHNMVGNTEEWTKTIWGASEDPEFEYEYNATDGREDPARGGDFEPHLYRVIRSCSYEALKADAHCTRRSGSDQTTRVPWRGFRVVMEVM